MDGPMEAAQQTQRFALDVRTNLPVRLGKQDQTPMANHPSSRIVIVRNDPFTTPVDLARIDDVRKFARLGCEVHVISKEVRAERRAVRQQITQISATAFAPGKLVVMAPVVKGEGNAVTLYLEKVDHKMTPATVRPDQMYEEGQIRKSQDVVDDVSVQRCFVQEGYDGGDVSFELADKRIKTQEDAFFPHSVNKLKLCVMKVKLNPGADLPAPLKAEAKRFTAVDLADYIAPLGVDETMESRVNALFTRYTNLVDNAHNRLIIEGVLDMQISDAPPSLLQRIQPYIPSKRTLMAFTAGAVFVFVWSYMAAKSCPSVSNPLANISGLNPGFKGVPYRP